MARAGGKKSAPGSGMPQEGMMHLGPPGVLRKGKEGRMQRYRPWMWCRDLARYHSNFPTSISLESTWMLFVK